MTMNNWQTPVALLVVLGAVIYLVRAALARRRDPGGACGGGCGCPTADFKKSLNKRRSNA